MASESRKTVLIALGANAGIAVAKLFAGLIGGSSAMLAEGAHSIADTTNQLFLLGSLKFSERKPDEQHPFGYGKERFLWTFMAAIFIFVGGSLFSIYEGVTKLMHGSGEPTKFGLTYAVLAFAFVAEGISLLRALRQTRSDASTSTSRRKVRRSMTRCWNWPGQPSPMASPSRSRWRSGQRTARSARRWPTPSPCATRTACQQARPQSS